MSRPAKAGATDEVRPPRRRLCARPVQHAEGWRFHRCGGIRRSSDARRARTPHAALALPAAARRSRGYYPLTLASGSDPRHESRVALLGPAARLDGFPELLDGILERLLLEHAPQEARDPE